MKKTNEKGYSFEIDKSLTTYAQEDKYVGEHLQKGLGNNIVVLHITKGEDSFGYILFNTDTQTPESNELGLEAMACYIDVLRFKKDTEYEGEI